MSEIARLRQWRGPVDFKTMLQEMPGGMEFAVRDFALMTLAGELSLKFPGQLIFKGGFVLRHGHGHLRFSTDADATRDNPPKNKFDADAFAETIREASIKNLVEFETAGPATNTGRSLDFDSVRVSGPDFKEAFVQVEVSYREPVILEPRVLEIGEPFYVPFDVSVMRLNEMAAEKLRALAQRNNRETDLADLAVLLADEEAADTVIAELAVKKFVQVAPGQANRIERIETHLNAYAYTYDDEVPKLFPEAPSYEDAYAIVWPRIKVMVP